MIIELKDESLELRAYSQMSFRSQLVAIVLNPSH